MDALKNQVETLPHEAKPGIEAKKYRCFDVETMQLGKQHLLVRARRTGAARVLPFGQAGILLSCNTFGTLMEHGMNRCREMAQQFKKTLSVQEVQYVKSLLTELTKEGFLTSEAEVLADLARRDTAAPSSAAPARIETISIPTRNRTGSLRRAVSSYAEHARHYDRKPSFLICDDSEEAEVCKANKHMLQDLKRRVDLDIYYLDRDRRIRYAEALARHTRLPADVLSFALLGDDRCPTAYGATRNALLLQTAGTCCLQVDDDTVCEVVTAPDKKTGLGLSSEPIVSAFRFHETFEAALASAPFVEQDLLSAHEQLLGRSVHDCVAAFRQAGEDIHFSKIAPRFLSRLRGGQAQVALSFAGSVGDIGMDDNQWRLFFQGGTYDRLIADAQRYRWQLGTRQVQKMPARPVISDAIRCMGMNMGLDNRTLLPPFMPVLRSEDSIFGGIVDRCFSSVFCGYLPFGIVHAPPEPRAPYDHVLGFRGFRTNDLLLQLIDAADLCARDDEAGSMQALGRALHDAGTLPQEAFYAYVRSVFMRVFSQHLLQVEQRLEENSAAPAYWINDVKTYIAASMKAATQPTFGIPSDLNGDRDERLTLLRSLIRKFGALLVHWPQIVEAAQALPRQDGYTAEKL